MWVVGGANVFAAYTHIHTHKHTHTHTHMYWCRWSETILMLDAGMKQTFSNYFKRVFECVAFPCVLSFLKLFVSRSKGELETSRSIAQHLDTAARWSSKCLLKTDLIVRVISSNENGQNVWRHGDFSDVTSGFKMLSQLFYLYYPRNNNQHLYKNKNNSQSLLDENKRKFKKHKVHPH